jgi:hypothetical protein
MRDGHAQGRGAVGARNSPAGSFEARDVLAEARAADHWADAAPVHAGIRQTLARRDAHHRRGAVGQQDILGLGGATMASVALGNSRYSSSSSAHHPPLPHADKITGFAYWLGGVLNDVVLGRDGSWTTPFVGEAGDVGRQRAMNKVGPPGEGRGVPEKAAVSQG